MKNNPSQPSLRSKGRGLKGIKQAFTLVELIVVITILAILGTIAFLSFQGYSRDARDSKRTSDINNLNTSLELFNVNTGKYPVPDSYTTITYSGGTEKVWYQGIAGDGVTTNLKQLNEKPLDPLTNSSYIYSVTNSYNEYEVLALYEGNIAQVSSPVRRGLGGGLVPYANAATTTLTPKIVGNYNGVYVKTKNYIIPTPSIIMSEPLLVGTLIPLTTENIKSLVMTNGTNIPKTAVSQTSTGGLNINLAAYTGSITSKSTQQKLIDVMNIIKSAYSGSIISNTDKIGYILKQNRGEEIVNTTNNIFSLKVPVKKESVSDCQTNGQIIYGTVTGKESWLTCNSDIIVCGGSGSGYTISACNVGATSVALSDNSNKTTSYGGLYQWGNNYNSRGGQFINGNIYPTTVPQITTAQNYTTYTSNAFVQGTADWTNQDNTGALRGAQWNICPANYHIPTHSEWIGIITILGSTQVSYSKTNQLKIPNSGYRNFNNASLLSQGSDGYYWSSSPYGINGGYDLSLYSGYISHSDLNNRAFGFSMRCFKN